MMKFGPTVREQFQMRMAAAQQRPGMLRPRQANQGTFDAAAYYAQNPDVAQAGVDPWQHWQQYGQAEGRQFAFRPRPGMQRFASPGMLGGPFGGGMVRGAPAQLPGQYAPQPDIGMVQGPNLGMMFQGPQSY